MLRYMTNTVSSNTSVRQSVANLSPGVQIDENSSDKED